MSNPDSIFNGQAETLDPLVGPDGTVYLKAAGDSLGVPTGASDPRAPHVVQIYVGSAATPTGLVGVQAAGSLGAATYYYRVSALTAAGESLACAEVGTAIAATHGVALTWTAVTGATGYRIYGRTTGAELLIATVTAPTVTYTDDGSITPAGALPTANSARFAQVVEAAKAPTATLANVAASASSVTLQAANTLRKGWSIVNDSSAILYLKCAASAASTTSFNVKLQAEDYWECPFSYTGEIRGIWATATGSGRVCEYT